MTTIQEKLVEVATVANAKEYFATPDQFVFCLDLLGLLLVEDGDRFCEKWVNQLEDLFEEIKFAGFFEGPVDQKEIDEFIGPPQSIWWWGWMKSRRAK